MYTIYNRIYPHSVMYMTDLFFIVYNDFYYKYNFKIEDECNIEKRTNKLKK